MWQTPLFKYRSPIPSTIDELVWNTSDVSWISFGPLFCVAMVLLMAGGIFFNWLVMGVKPWTGLDLFDPSPLKVWFCVWNWLSGVCVCTVGQMVCKLTFQPKPPPLPANCVWLSLNLKSFYITMVTGFVDVWGLTCCSWSDLATVVIWRS